MFSITRFNSAVVSLIGLVITRFNPAVISVICLVITRFNPAVVLLICLVITLLKTKKRKRIENLLFAGIAWRIAKIFRASLSVDFSVKGLITNRVGMLKNKKGAWTITAWCISKKKEAKFETIMKYYNEKRSQFCVCARDKLIYCKLTETNQLTAHDHLCI